MEIIMKIPFLLAILAALITGFFSIAGNKDLNETCIRMIIAMVSFYLIGLFAKSTFKSIVEEQNRQKAEAEKLKMEEELEKQRLAGEQAEQTEKNDYLGKKIDFRADEEIDDGFTPLDLTKAVRTKMKE